MGRLYSVCLISTQQMRDMRLEFILNEEFIEEDYIHTGDFVYVFENDNQISDRITTNSKIYKTLSGAQRFRSRSKNDPTFNLRFPIRNEQGMWIKNYNNDGSYHVVVVDITDKWNNLIDGVIERKTEEFNKEIKKWESKKSR